MAPGSIDERFVTLEQQDLYVSDDKHPWPEKGVGPDGELLLGQ
jgi:hypothetical protein